MRYVSRILKNLFHFFFQEERLEMIQSYIDFQEQAKVRIYFRISEIQKKFQKERLETIQSFIDSHEQVQVN